MFTKKIQRHDKPLVITPPSTGPIATATPVNAPNTPKATPRSDGLNAWASKAREIANMIAPPTPCNARASERKTMPVAPPHNADPSVKTTIPMANMRRRPRRSAVEPAVSRKAASVNAYASMTHCRSDSDPEKARWMSGSATFTIVMSSSSMNTPVQTAISVHHLRAMVFPLFLSSRSVYAQ